MGLLDPPALSQAALTKGINQTTRSAASLFRGMVPCVRRGTNLGYGSYSDGTATSGMYRKAHFVLFDVADIRLVYSNYGGAQGSAIGDGPNIITVKASVELPVAAVQAAMSATYPVTFNGATTASVPPGGTVVSDPIPVTAVKGQVVYSNTYVSVASAGQKWPLGDMLLVNGLNVVYFEGGAVGAPTSDTTAGPTAPTGYVAGYGPTTIVGSPARGVSRPVTIYGLGDSILYGANDYTPRWEGWLGRACETLSLPVLNTGHPGDRASFTSGTALRQRIPLAAACDVMIVNYGANDLLAGALTLAQFQAAVIYDWQAGAARGLRVYQTTLTPRTSSSDDFSTVANQTPETTNTYSTYRTQFNAWLRDGAPITIATGIAAATGVAASPAIARTGASTHPLTGYLEVGDVVETARDSGKWQIGRTINDLSITSGSRTITSATANFTAADIGRNISLYGIAGAGVKTLARIYTLNSATSVDYEGVAPSTQTATGQKAIIAGYTDDGVHPSIRGHQAIAAALSSILPTL